MNVRHAVVLLTAALLGGCASHHGTYEPACIAFAGDSVTLDGESFTWDRSTDAVRVDADGRVIDRFPDYPHGGSYAMRGKLLRMQAEDGRPMSDYYLQKIAGRYRLLTADQNENWQERGQYDDCVLTLGGEVTP